MGRNGAEPIVVTGLGAVTPLGLDVKTTWEALLAGRSGVAPITLFDASDLRTTIAGEVRGFDPLNYVDHKNARRLDRFTHFAMAASQEAIEDAKLQIPPEGSLDIGVVIGSGIGGITSLLEQVEVARLQGPRRVSPFLVPAMLPDTGPGLVSIRYGLRGPNFSVAAACATSGVAIGEAWEVIRRGDAQVMLAGGAEAGIVHTAVAAFTAVGAVSTKRNHDPQKASRPFDADRDGFVLAEGAAVLVLETLSHARKRGAHIYCEMTGYGNTADAFHLTAPMEQGQGAVEVMQMALRKSGSQPDDVDYINAHGTSTALNDRSETAALKTLFGERAYCIPVNSTKSMTGHMVGAAGALEAIATIKTIETGWIHPTINYEFPDPECDLDYVPNEARKAANGIRVAISNSFGFGGHNTCLVFRAFDGA